MTKEKIIQQGAEAVLIRKGDELLKRRVKKSYRLRELDEKLRKRRTKREARLLVKASKLIDVPKVLRISDRDKEIDMEFIDGLKLSEELDNLDEWKEVCFQIGKNIAKLHDVDIIHGDLTTSNMIWVKRDRGDSAESPPSSAPTILPRLDRTKGQLYFIDFGLGFANGRIEDKAVDLHLIKQALEAKHFANPENGKFSGPTTSKNQKEVEGWEKFFDGIVEGYRTSANFEKVMKQFEKVEKRGRYKKQY